MERALEPSLLAQSRERGWSLGAAFAVMIVLFAIGPFVVYPVFLMKALCFALFACAFNLLIGYVGLASFGHALFFGWASYVTAYSAKAWGWPPELAIIGGTAIAALLGFVAGGLAIRRQGIYFAMITLALSQMMYFFALQAKFTGGEDGIQGVPRGRLFGLFDLSSEMTMYVFVLVVFVAGFLLIYRIINSPFGEVLKAIRENEPRTISLGYKTERYKLVAFVVMVVLFAIGPFVVYPVFLMKALCFALFACAFNLLIGYVGLASFGHALFFGWASYVTAYSAKAWGWPPELAIIGGTAIAALLGFVAGGLAIRRQGIYFAMITLALSQMMYFFALQAKFTGGEDGIQGVPRGRLFGLFDLSSEMTMYVFVLVVFVAGFLLIYRIINSPFGEVLKAIRENEPRTISLGYKTERYKLVAFVLSATLAGLAGAMNSLVFQLASLTDVHWTMSGDVLLMTLLGGLGTVFGPVVGAFIVIAMQNYLAPFGQWVLVIQGVIFVICVLLFRRGVVGELARLARVQL
jgi:branched-chain amino acid transport system permease protein